jgi:uncharacterized protein YoxC
MEWAIGGVMAAVLGIGLAVLSRKTIDALEAAKAALEEAAAEEERLTGELDAVAAERDALRVEVATLKADAETRAKANGEAIAVANAGRVEAMSRVNVALVRLTEAREFLEGGK